MKQDAIRQWARERNIPVGQRGRLPQAIVLAYQKEMGQTPDGSQSPERPKQSAGATIQSFDPLADYLEPRFGDIYTQYDELRDRWTPKLKDAVTHYLLHEVTDTDFEALSISHLTHVPIGDTRSAQVQSIVDREYPSEIAYALHSVAIEHAPSLDAVLGQDSDQVGLKIDCARWLYENGSYGRLVEVARISGLLRTLHVPEVPLPDADELDARVWLTDELLDRLSIEALVDAWHYVITPATTDLTDEEWSLLEPLLPTQGGAKLVPSTTRRQVINGLLYLDAHPERRLLSPLVYRRSYRQGGIFARILESLEDIPEAERITAWLRGELEEPGMAKQGRRRHD